MQKRSHVDGIDLLSDVEGIFYCHIYCLIVHNLFVQFNKCVKSESMFLNIPDSVICSEESFCFECNSLFKSHFDGIDV